MTVPYPHASIELAAGNSERLLLVKQLPFELREHVVSYLQEELYVPALTLLYDVLTSGADLPASTPRRIFLPSTQIIALIATLVVYPPLTTRLPPTEKPEASDLALRYLQCLSHTGAPDQLLLPESLAFGNGDRIRTPRKKRRLLLDGESNVGRAEIDGQLSTRAATEDCLFDKAEDFWSVLGWALNCSIKHQKRWERWQVWLQVLLDILERDLEDRLDRSSDHDPAATPEKADHGFGEALLSKYLASSIQGRTQKRRVMRAIFADASKTSMAEFREVWKNETMPPRAVDPAQSEKVLDIDNDQYGDYMDNDDEDDLGYDMAYGRDASSRRRKRSDNRLESDEDDSDVQDSSSTLTIADVGGMSSILVRQRMIGLLSTYTYHYPKGWTDWEDFYDLCTEFIRPLPLHVFQHFVSPSRSFMDPASQTSLICMLLRPLLSSEAPSFNEGEVDQDDLEKYYLPFTASKANVVDNAKVSLLVEALMRLLWKHWDLKLRPSLSDAVHNGNKARIRKTEFDGRRKSGQAVVLEEEARSVLYESSQRMAALLDILDP